MRATFETAGLVLVVFLLQILLGVTGLSIALALSAPIDAAAYTLVTSVYAHGGIGHLLANLVALLVVGPLVERRTTRLRFHLFFVSMGAIAGVTQVTVGGLVGPSPAVLGASGAIFALCGYLLAGNVATATVLDRIQLDRRGQFALFAVIAVGLTIVTAAPGVALVAHAVGAFCGLVAGRVRLLDARG